MKLWVICLFIFFAFPSHSIAKVYEFTEGNFIRPLFNSRGAVSYKIRLVQNAKKHIHIMTYYWDDSSFPNSLVEELIKAHERGVEIRIMTTYLPSLAKDIKHSAKKKLLASLEESQSQSILSYLELTPGNSKTITNNLHEKIFLVDGETAILGGRNISDNDFKSKDLELLLRGPVVNQVQDHFQEMQTFLIKLKTKKCKPDDEECIDQLQKLNFSQRDLNYFPPQQTYDDSIKARIITNDTLIQQHEIVSLKKDLNSIKDDIVDTVTKTEFDQLRAYNYFVLPTPKYKNFLIENLKANKKISLITNSHQSSKFISDKGYLLSLKTMKELVDNGASIYEWSGDFFNGLDQLSYLHEKMLLFDNDHAFIGSHNYGLGSTFVSSEIVIEFYSRSIVDFLTKIYDRETGDNIVTNTATSDSLKKEIKNNRLMIKFLNLGFIKTLISELY
jgi:putative cardiolipin synthase